MKHRLTIAGVSVVLVLLGGTVLEAQQGLARGTELPLRPQYERGQPVSPIFEGWYENPDGTYSLSFGYFNRNSEEVLEIPVGPDNSIEPAEFGGDQPTNFSTGEGQFPGRGWGVFTVVVPEDYGPDDEVVWTLTSKGVTHSVPGRVGIGAYELAEVDEPMGVGSMPPPVRFDPEGPEGMGPTGITAEKRRTTSVGAPVEISVWTADNWDPEYREAVPVDLEWFKHQGPAGGTVTFEPQEAEVEAAGGEATTTATFSEPGDYVLRVRAGNFSSRDSSLSNHCCWTNGYVRVTVTP